MKRQRSEHRGPSREKQAYEKAHAKGRDHTKGSKAWGRPAQGSLLEKVIAVLVAWGFLWWGWRFITATTITFQDGRQVCLLFDDAMISMTYARNAVAGLGLQWSRFGQPVEGFSNPLWTLLMAVFHLFPHDPWTISRRIQWFGWFLLAANGLVIGLLARERSGARPGQRLAGWVPPVLATLAYYPLNFWTLRGFETGLQALVISLGLWLGERCLWPAREESSTSPAAGRFSGPIASWAALGAVLGAGVLTRMDMLLGVAIISGMVKARRWAVLGRAGTIWGWPAVAGAATFLLPNVAYLAFRWSYYGDLLPNTYYHKATGIDSAMVFARGWAVLQPVVWTLGPIVLLGLVGLPFLPAGWSRWRQALLLILPVVYMGYSVSVGGDVWEDAGIIANRWIAFGAPFLFLAASDAVSALLAQLTPGVWSRQGSSLLRGGGALATLLVLVTVSNGFISQDRARQWAYLTVSAAPYSTGENVRWFVRALGLKRYLLPGARVAVTWSGIPAYFLETEMVDLLGINDAHIARQSVEIASGSRGTFRPGHNKWDYDYSLGVLQPDAVFQIWGIDTEERVRLMKTYGYTDLDQVWWRHGSSNIRPPQPLPGATPSSAASPSSTTP